jgi:outer membrane protein OmpA-like peptidoglycan-associated protein
MYEEYDDGEGGGTSLGRKIALGVGVVAIALLGWFVVKPQLTGDDDAEQVTEASATVASVEATAAEDAGPEREDPAATTADADDSETPASVATGDAGAPTTEASTTELAPSVDETTAPAPTQPVAPTTTAPVGAYDTLPDGSPEPAIVIYDEGKTTMTGEVPDQAAKDQLETIAKAYAKPGQENVDNQLTINPAVPRNLGVRVVELTSVRFPDGSAEIRPEHAAELDRVVNAMTALPHITTTVIGHADQRGDEVANYVLSEQRANAVVYYIASKGIDPTRLSARAVGEADLLSINNDDAALALNRRTEFIIVGLIQ